MEQIFLRSKALLCAFGTTVLCLVLGLPISGVARDNSENEWDGKAVVVVYPLKLGSRELKPEFRCPMYHRGVRGELITESVDPSVGPIGMGAIRSAALVACDTGKIVVQKAPDQKMQEKASTEKSPADQSSKAPSVAQEKPLAPAKPEARKSFGTLWVKPKKLWVKSAAARRQKSVTSHPVTPPSSQVLGKGDFVTSDPKQDSVSKSQEGIVFAKIYVSPPQGIEGPPRLIETSYLCRNGSGSQGEIQNPSYLVGAEQIRRSHDVCRAIRDECLDSGLRLGRKDLSKWLQESGASCEEAESMGKAIEEYPFGSSISSRCIHSNGDREAFNRGRTVAERDRIAQYKIEKACSATRSADARSKGMLVTPPVVIFDRSPSSIGTVRAIND